MNKILVAEKLCKEYPLPKGILRVFDGLNFSLEKGELAAIMGVSGVGKTTLLNLIGALDRPTSGRIFLDGKDLQAKNEREMARFRNKEIGFIYQFYHLLPEFTALENTAMPLFIRRIEKKEALRRAGRVLNDVYLKEKADLRPHRLSGGEQQRIAIARALVNEPRLLLADEPTGNLDWKTGESILKLVRELHQKKGLSSIIVTHSEKVAGFCDKVYLMEKGDLKLLSHL
ncbi:MAG: ABC transporter ATP-binding protein [Candidatus Aminicenantes bacterium]|nr:ABC transporter ATP-binding protein [Candidatus Aminicenantes bacterium]